MFDTQDQCASSILETIPLIMRWIRSKMRTYRDRSLSIPQFRAMLFIRRNPETSLSLVAEHLGLTPATTSKLIQGLVTKKIIHRQTVSTNRRKVQLSLTNNGENILSFASQKTRASIIELIKSLSTQELNTIHSAMAILSREFLKTELGDQ